MKRPLAAEWAALQDHFQHQAKSVDRLREAGRDGVLWMWASQTTEGGKRLSRFARGALIEQHCELFGTWPEQQEPPLRSPDL